MRLFVRTHLERAARLATQQLQRHPSSDTEAVVREAVALVAEDGEPVYAEVDILRAIEAAAASDPPDLPAFVLQYLRERA